MYKKKTFYFSSLLGGFLSGGFCPGSFCPGGLLSCSQNYPLVFYKVQRSTNIKRIKLKFFLLSVAFEWNVNHFAPHMGNNCYRNHKKNCIILESNWECAHGLIDITVVNNKNVLVNNI
jgi:hypothetical protein